MMRLRLRHVMRRMASQHDLGTRDVRVWGTCSVSSYKDILYWYVCHVVTRRRPDCVVHESFRWSPLSYSQDVVGSAYLKVAGSGRLDQHCVRW